MTITIDSLIENRVSDCGAFKPSELIEFVVTRVESKYRLTMGYMVYSHCGSLWRPIMTLKHLFPSEDAAEVVIERIFAKREVDLAHWDSPRDPDQEELLL